MHNQIIYLDNAATTRTYYAAIKDMMSYFTLLYGNPSSVYEFAGKSKKALAASRKKIAGTINANEKEIYFTSGGTESDNWAIKSICSMYKSKGKHIITSKIEHHAVLNTLKSMEKDGYEVSYISCDREGIIDLYELESKIREDTILVSIMAANNEIGSLQPIDEIGEICRKRNVIFHTDAVQMYCHLPIDVKKSNISMLSVSGHKFHGPKGVGFLYVDDSISIAPMICGGGQERGKRSGTENVPCIVGMARAAEISCEMMKKNIQFETRLRDYMIHRIMTEIPGAHINGSLTNRLPGNINVSFDDIDSVELLALMDIDGVCVSSGSACSNNESNNESHVLKAIGLSEKRNRGTIRITLSSDTTFYEINRAFYLLKNNVVLLRKGSTIN